MEPPQEGSSLLACDCITPLGDSRATWRALCEGRSALQLHPVFWDNGQEVPLALFEPMGPADPPRWFDRLIRFLDPFKGRRWGGPATPVFISSSNFGIDALYYLRTLGRMEQLPYASAHGAVEQLRAAMGWRGNISLFSHACVSAHIALAAATRSIEAGAEQALVVSFDFVSPFVAGGFNALKILNGAMPQPYHQGENGSIALGDGAAYALLGPSGGGFRIESQSFWNEMYHFTANNPDGSGFASALDPLVARLGGRRACVKGHGTGTLEAGRLEACGIAQALPDAPLVGWKGALGHTLGSCGLIEMAIACRAFEGGRIPGTVGSTPPYFADNVRGSAFDADGVEAFVVLSNAFGGAHAGLLLVHDPLPHSSR